MAILRSLDGKFYELPDEDLTKFEMSEEKVKEMGGDVGGGEMVPQQEGGDPGMMHQDPPGTININLNLGGGGGGQMMMPQQQQGQEGEQQQQGDVQGHRWVIYHNRYWAYRNRYWAYRNRY